MCKFEINIIWFIIIQLPKNKTIKNIYTSRLLGKP